MTNNKKHPSQTAFCRLGGMFSMTSFPILFMMLDLFYVAWPFL